MVSINLTLSEGLLKELDETRGDVPRVRFIRRAIERAVDEAERERRGVAAAESIVAKPEGVPPAIVESARRVLSGVDRAAAFRRATQKP